SESNPVRLSDERCRVEGRRGPFFPLVLDVLLDESSGSTLRLGQRGLRLSPRPERAVLVVRLELDRFAFDFLLESRGEGPVVLGNEIFDLPFAVDAEVHGRPLQQADEELVSSQLLRSNGD